MMSRIEVHITLLIKGFNYPRLDLIRGDVIEGENNAETFPKQQAGRLSRRKTNDFLTEDVR